MPSRNSALEAGGRRHGQGAVGLAVERALHADELRLALGQLHALADLQSGLDRLRARRREKRHLQRIGQKLRDVVSERALQFMRRDLDAIDDERVVALAFGGDDARMIVAEPDDADAGGKIEERAPILEADLDPLRAFDVHVAEAEDIEHLQKIFVEVVRVELVRRRDIEA